MLNKIDSLQVGRGFAALTVLFFHTEITLRLPLYLGKPIFPVSNAGHSGVVFFFVLSGFVIFLAHRKDIGNPGALLNFFLKRAIRIFPLLWVTIALLLVALFILQKPEPIGTHYFTNLLSALFLFPAIDENILDVAWTLRQEMLFYIVFAILIANRKIGLFAFITWAIMCIPWLPFHFEFPLDKIFMGNNILFVFGMISAYIFMKEYSIPISIHFFILVFSVIVYFSCWYISYKQLPIDRNIVKYGFGISAALFMLSAACIERSKRLRMPKFLVFLGEASYAIYLIHYPAIYVFSAIGSHMANFVPNWFIYFFVATASLFAGLGFHLAVERPILDFLRSHTSKSPFQSPEKKVSTI
jgi:exopolysaccharide production protein ExoZ